MTKQLDGKTALVTGASSGIGRAAAMLFAAQGAKVVVGARREAELRAVAAEIAAAGGQATALAGDVRDDDYARALVACAHETYGGLDIAFNSAGTLGAMAPIETATLDDWRTVVDTNLIAAFLGARH